MRLFVRCSGTSDFLWLLKLLFLEFYFTFFFLWTFLSSPTWFLLWFFTRTYIFFWAFIFFSDFGILPRLVNFFFRLVLLSKLVFSSDLYCLEKMCVRKNTSRKIKFKSEKEHKKQKSEKIQVCEMILWIFPRTCTFS